MKKRLKKYEPEGKVLDTSPTGALRNTYQTWQKQQDTLKKYAPDGFPDTFKATGEVSDEVSNVIASLFLPIPPVGKMVGEASQAVKSAYKAHIQPFKPNPNMMYRGIGKEGYKDALEQGVFRAKQSKPSFVGTKVGNSNNYEQIDISKKFKNAYYAPSSDFDIVKYYADDYIAEVPKTASTFRNRYNSSKHWSQIAETDIPINKGKIYKKHWLKGYKEVPKPNYVEQYHPLPGAPEVQPNKWLNTTDNFGMMESGKVGLGRPTTQEDIYNSIMKKKQGGRISSVPKMGFGGTLGGILKVAAPFASLIPGVGIPAGMALGAAGNMLGDQLQQMDQPKPQMPQVPMVNNNLGSYMPQYQSYETGGKIYGDQPAELESGETFQTPQGQITNVTGDSHANGGETFGLPGGTKVMSKILNSPAFRKATRGLSTKKYEKILSDPNSDKLLKQAAQNNIKVNNDKFTELYKIQEMKKTRGLSTPGTYSKGGQIPKYDGLGDSEVPYNRGANLLNQYFNHNQDFNQMGMETASMRNTSYSPTYQPGENRVNITNTNYSIPLSSPGSSRYGNTGPLMSDETFSTQGNPYGTQGSPSYKPSWAETAGEFALNSLGDVKNLFAKSDRVNYSTANPSLLDPRAALSRRRIQSRELQGRTASASGGNAALYQANMNANHAGDVQSDFEIRSGYDNQNAGIKNNFAQYNNNIKNQQTVDQAMNDQMAQDRRTQGLSQLGFNAADALRYRQGEGYDQMLKDEYYNTYKPYQRSKRFRTR